MNILINLLSIAAAGIVMLFSYISAFLIFTVKKIRNIKTALYTSHEKKTKNTPRRNSISLAAICRNSRILRLAFLMLAGEVFFIFTYYIPSSSPESAGIPGSAKAILVFIGIQAFSLIILAIHGDFVRKPDLHPVVIPVYFLSFVGVLYQFSLKKGGVSPSAHMVFSIAGTAIMLATVIFLPGILDIMKKPHTYIMLSILALCIVNLLFGAEKNGARLWLRIGSLSLQPMEFAKPLIFISAMYALKRDEPSKIPKIQFGASVAAAAATSLLIKDLGSVIVFSVIGLCVALTGCNGLITKKNALIVTVCFMMIFVTMISLFPHFRIRVDNLAAADSQNYVTQQLRARLGIMNGGLFGIRLSDGVSFIDQAYGASNDLAFAGVWEKLGMIMALLSFLSAMAVISMPVIITSGKAVSSEDIVCPMCFSSVFFSQIFIHIFGSLDIFFFSGINFPFVSSGGSGLTAYFICAGILMVKI